MRWSLLIILVFFTIFLHKLGYYMNVADFRYMFCGKSVGVFRQKDAGLLENIQQIGQEHNRALLLIHGFSSSPAVFRTMLPQLHNYDAIVCPKLAGHGESIEEFMQSSGNDWLESAKNICASLVENYKQVDVLGLSLGGVLACKLSEIYKLNHLYLLAPALDIKTNVTYTLALAKILNALGFRRLRNRAGNIHCRGHAELTYRQLPISAIIEILTLIKEADFSRPNCPTDIFLGRFDEVVDSDAVAKRFANSQNTTIHWLENSAHILPLDGDVDFIIDILSDTLYT